MTTIRQGFLAVWQFFLAPLCDTKGGKLSGTKVMAFCLFSLLWHAVEAGHPISVTELAMSTTILAAMFGKSTFSFFLDKAKAGTP
jgi:hypothetical protein